MRADLVIYPDPRLHEESRLLGAEEFDGRWDWLAADLVETMLAEKAAGLAAIQVGVPVAMFVVQAKDGPVVMVNPVWGAAGETEPMTEGCLSFPGVGAVVPRYPGVTANWLDLQGEFRTEMFTGITAQAIQHESEHLRGETFLKHLTFTKVSQVRTRMKQYARRTK